MNSSLLGWYTVASISPYAHGQQKKAVRVMNSHGLDQKQKAAGKEFTHGFEVLLASTHLAVDKPLHRRTTTSTSSSDHSVYLAFPS